jgi:hypothetical protein
LHVQAYPSIIKGMFGTIRDEPCRARRRNIEYRIVLPDCGSRFVVVLIGASSPKAITSDIVVALIKERGSLNGPSMKRARRTRQPVWGRLMTFGKLTAGRPFLSAGLRESAGAA